MAMTQIPEAKAKDNLFQDADTLFAFSAFLEFKQQNLGVMCQTFHFLRRPAGINEQFTIDPATLSVLWQEI